LSAPAQSTQQQPSSTAAPGEMDVPAAWVEAFREGWRAPAGPREFAEHFQALLAPEVRLVQPGLPPLLGHRAFSEGFVAPLFALFDGLRGEIENWAARGEILYIELTLRGTLAGKPVSWRVCDRVTLREGLAIERESYTDPTPVIRALLTRPGAWPRYLRIRARTWMASSRNRSTT
jgi:ketosteroid isomerase-like protein